MTDRAVIFDLFGTLIPNYDAVEYARVARAMAEIVGAPVADFARLYGSETWSRRATGALATTEDAIAYVCAALDLPMDTARVAEATGIRIDLTRRTLRPLPGVVDTLETLRGRGYGIGLVSDCSAEVPLLWPGTELSALVDAAIFSCDVGMKKPDPRIYLLACERLGVQPSACLYVGDGSGQELSGAAAIGMTPVLVRVPYAETTDTDRPEVTTWDGRDVMTIPDILALIE